MALLHKRRQGRRQYSQKRTEGSNCYLVSVFSQSIHGEIETRQPQLQAVVDLAEALKAVLRGHGGLVDDKVSLLRCNWIAVTSRAEEWLNLLLVRESKFKKNQLYSVVSCFVYFILVLKLSQSF